MTREIVYVSRKARTSGNFTDLAEAGRMDIAIHTIIQSFFLSRARRDDVIVHLFFSGPPNPPQHLEIRAHAEDGTLSPISKKDVAGLIKRMLYKGKNDRRVEAAPGCFITKEGILKYLAARIEEGRNVYVLHEKGEDIRTVKIDENPIFVLGDQEGIPFKELRRIRKSTVPVAVGPRSYFASQVVAIVQNELDRRGL